MIRAWLAAVLRGKSPTWAFAPDQDLTAIVRAAHDEGVVALIHERLQDAAHGLDVPAELRERIASAARTKAVQSLEREAQTRRILARLEQAGLRVLLLKGSALAYWVYDSPYLRECADIDLLFATRADAEQAAALLVELGYRSKAIPGDLTIYEVTCVRGDDDSPSYLEADLHWGIGCTAMFAGCFDFDELDAGSLPLPRLGPTARGLGPVHAYLHSCIHRILEVRRGRANYLKWLFDLHLLAQRFSAEDWESLVTLSEQKGLCGTCLHGLQAAADAFGTRMPPTVVPRLVAGQRGEAIDVARMGSWVYIQRMTLRALPSHAARLRWWAQRLWPQSGYLDAYYEGEQGKLKAFGRYVKRGLGNLKSR
jgi:hypothetical protein